MKSIIAIFISTLFVAQANAIGIGNDNPPSTGGDIKNTNTAVAGANATAGAAAIVGVGVSNRISNDTRVNAANYVSTNNPSNSSASVVVNEAPIPANTRVEQAGKVAVKSVPNVFAGNVYPTAPCMGSSTVGAAAMGWGASVGTSWSDHECGKRETARSFQNMGMTEDAIAILCSSEYAAVAPSCKKQ